MKTYDKFVLALNAKKKVQLHFHESPNSDLVSRKCIPIDYCEYKKEGSNEEGYCFRVWDCENKKLEKMSINDIDIKKMEILEESFEDEELKAKGFCTSKCILIVVISLVLALALTALIKFI